MSITYRFTIDDTVIQEAQNIEGWDKLVTTIKRDASDLKGLLVTQDAQLLFTADQYRYFKNKYFNEGICQDIPVLIEQSFDEGVNFSILHEGKIFLSDVELDLLKGISKAKTSDDSFFARIDNNKSIKTNPRGGWSKNGEPVPTPSQYAVTLFRPADNTVWGTRQMFKLFDVMRYLVRWMSDGEVEFESDLLETDLQLAIQRGDVLRTGVQPSPFWEVSFADIYNDLKGIRDISYCIELDAFGNPVLRLELASYFHQNSQATDQDGNEIVFTDPETLETKVKVDELYSQIKLGSEIIADFPYLEFPENIRYNGFKEEELYILGQCNIDRTLNLLKDFVVSSNVIEDNTVEAGVTTEDYDEDIFLIHVENINDGALTAEAIGTNPEGTVPPAFYNMALRNSEIANSYFGTFQNGLVAGFLNFTANDFQAVKTIATLHTLLSGGGTIDINPVPYEGEVDPGNNFNLATEYYTCPVTGYYTFNFQLLLTRLGNGAFSPLFTIATAARIVDNAGNTLAEVIKIGLDQGQNLPISVSASIYRTAGDQIGTRVFVTYFLLGQPMTMRVDVQTKFSCSASPDTGGVVNDYDPQDVRNVLMSFKYKLTPQTFNSILANTRGLYKIRLSKTNTEYKGWIEQIKYNHRTQDADIILKTSINTIGTGNQQGLRLLAYRFEFNMATVADQIDSFTYDNGVSNVTMTVPLAKSETDIKSQILAAFGGAGISVSEIVITRVSLGGARFRYKIIIVNPNFTMDIVDVSGNSTISTFYYY